MALPTSIRRFATRTLASLGFQIVRTRPLDLRERGDELRDAVLRRAASLGRGVVVDVPLARWRHAELGALSRNPFVATLVANASSYAGSPLEEYYTRCTPQTAAEVLGVPAGQAPGFASRPAPAFLLPWVEGDPDEILRARAHYMRSEARQHGYDLHLEDGFTAFGPVSEAKGTFELSRTAAIYRSMGEHGFLRHDHQHGDIEGWMLIASGGDWCVVVNAGQHRLFAAAAHGYSSIPLRLRWAPVKREEVDYWPQVSAGRITREGALAVFDRIMRGEPSPACQWSASGDRSDCISSSEGMRQVPSPSV